MHQKCHCNAISGKMIEFSMDNIIDYCKLRLFGPDRSSFPSPKNEKVQKIWLEREYFHIFSNRKWFLWKQAQKDQRSASQTILMWIFGISRQKRTRKVTQTKDLAIQWIFWEVYSPFYFPLESNLTKGQHGLKFKEPKMISTSFLRI